MRTTRLTSVLFVVLLAGTACGPQRPVGPQEAAPPAAPVLVGKADDLFNQAMEARQGGDLEGAIALLEEALVEEAEHVRARVTLASWLQDHAFPMARERRWDKAKPLYLRSAALARTLKGRKDSQADVVGILILATYNEACAYSATGEKEKAIESLRESLELGFLERDLGPGPSPKELLLTDPDLDPIREEKAFEELQAKYLPEGT